MSMAAIPFDSLDYFEKLKDAGFTEAQAKVQASALQTALNRHDEASRKELATRGDLQDVRTELKEDIQNVRLEVEKVRAQSREAELRLQKEIQGTETRLIKWQLGIAAGIVSVMLTGFGAIVAIMAKSLGWSGF